MANSLLTAYGTPTEYLTTDLNALAVGGVFLGAEIDNSTNRYLFLKTEIQLASANLSGQTSPGVELRLVESLDGTNYEDHDDKCYALTIPVANTNAAHRKTSGIIHIPPGKFKLAVVNSTGVIFAATGNVLDYITFTPTDT